ncbi:hypothetical protein HDU96_001704 [Phlyctochytrium bullatum]|nr:hypothetical protein HDU96_001704 [Phlyctochytrium bullatum]
MEVVGNLRSLELLGEFCSRFPKVIDEALWCDFAEGLRTLIPRNHSIVNVREDWSDFTLLEKACEYGHLKSAQILLDLGADVNPDDSADPSEGTNLELTRLILSHGGDMELPVYGNIALYDAIDGKDYEVARLFLEFGADISALPDDDSKTVLELAATNDDVEGLQIILDAGADDEMKRGALHWACKRPAARTAHMLVSNGVDVAHPSFRPPLLHATLSACYSIVRDHQVVLYLVRFLLNPCGDGRTVVHLVADVARCSWLKWDAAMEGVMDRVVRLDVDVNAKDKAGRTAVHAAAENEQKELLLWLLAREGVDVSAVDGRGKRWVDLALERG